MITIPEEMRGLLHAIFDLVLVILVLCVAGAGVFAWGVGAL